MYKKIVLGILCCGFVFSSEDSSISERKHIRQAERFGYTALCALADFKIAVCCKSCNRPSAKPFNTFLNDQAGILVMSYCFVCHTITEQLLTEFNKIASYKAWRERKLPQLNKGKEYFESYFEQLQIDINQDMESSQKLCRDRKDKKNSFDFLSWTKKWEAPTFASQEVVSQAEPVCKVISQKKPELEWVKIIDFSSLAT